LGPTHGGGKALGRAIAVSGGKQRSVGAALTEENRGGGRERWHRWMAKGNGGEDGATCLPTGDDRGGVSDRGGTTRGGRRQLGGFTSRTEIDTTTCGGQVGDATRQEGLVEESTNDRRAHNQLFPNAK
jgi:hypothetical protein